MEHRDGPEPVRAGPFPQGRARHHSAPVPSPSSAWWVYDSSCAAPSPGPDCERQRGRPGIRPRPGRLGANPERGPSMSDTIPTALDEQVAKGKAIETALRAAVRSAALASAV